MGNCKTCYHWEKWPKAPTEVGECSQLTVNASPDFDYLPEPKELVVRGTGIDLLILTHADFGCVHHAEKTLASEDAEG